MYQREGKEWKRSTIFPRCNCCSTDNSLPGESYVLSVLQINLIYAPWGYLVIEKESNCTLMGKISFYYKLFGVNRGKVSYNNVNALIEINQSEKEL